MRKRDPARSDADYAEYLPEPGGTVDDAVRTCGLTHKTLQEYFPGLLEGQAQFDRSLSFSAPLAPTDYFAFYQEDGRWAWRRVNQAESIVAVSGGVFREYSQCVADARRHGWQGKPMFLFL